MKSSLGGGNSEYKGPETLTRGSSLSHSKEAIMLGCYEQGEQ